MAQKIVDEISFNVGLDRDSDEKYIQEGSYRMMVNGLKTGDESYGVLKPMPGMGTIDLSTITGISAYTQLNIAGSVYDYQNSGVVLFVQTYDTSWHKHIVRYKEDGTKEGLIIDNDLLNFNENIEKAKIMGDLLIWQERGQPTQIINMVDALNDNVTYDNENKLSLIKKPPLYTIDFGYGYDDDFHGSNVFRRMFQFRQQYIYRDSVKSCFGNTSDIAFNEDVFDIEDNVVQKQTTKNFVDIKFNSGDGTVKEIRIAAREGNRGNWFEIGLIDKDNPSYVHDEQEGSGSVSYQNILNDNTDYYFRFFNTGGYRAIPKGEINKSSEFIPLQSDTLSELGGNRLVMGQNIHDYKDVEIGSLKMSPQYSGLPSSSGVYRSIKRGRYHQGAIRVLDGYGRSTEPIIDENLKFYVEDAYDTTNAGVVQLSCENIDTVTFPSWAEKYQFLLTSPYIPFIQIPILYADQYRDADGETDGTIALLIGFTVDSINDFIDKEIEELEKQLGNTEEEISNIKEQGDLTEYGEKELEELKEEKENIEKKIESTKQELGNSYKRALANLRQYEITKNDRIRILKKDIANDVPVDQTVDLQILDVIDENTYYRPSISNYDTQGGLWVKINAPDVDGYNLDTIKELGSHEWTEVKASASWTARYDHGSVINSNGRMFVIGGFDPSTTSRLNDVWYSDDKGLNWTKAVDLANWTARSNMAVAIDSDDVIYIMGGYDGTDDLNDVWYSTSDDGSSWSQATSSASWSARNGLSSVVDSNDVLYIIGGFVNSSSTYENDIWYSNDKGANWSQITYESDEEWSPGRTDHISVIDNKDTIYIIGGKYGFGTDEYLNEVWHSEGSDYTIWKKINASTPWTPRSDHAGVINFFNRIYIMGGYNQGKGTFNDVWYSDDEGLTWNKANSSAGWTERAGLTCVVDSQNVIYAIGGSGPVDEVWSKKVFASQWINSLIEIYKPAYSDFPDRFYEISGVYNITNTTNKTLNPANCFLKKQKLYTGGNIYQKGNQVTIWLEDAHLTHDFRSDNYTIGRAFIRTGIEKGISHPSIVYTNPHFEGTQINGLSQANYNNVAYLPDEYGKIYSLQNQSGIFKAIQAHKITAFYPNQSNILGQRKEFQDNIGTVHPKSIIQSPSGYIYGFDINVGPWRDTGNGIHELSGKTFIGGGQADYKMYSFFNDVTKKLRARATEGSNDVVTAYDDRYGLVLMAFPNITLQFTYNDKTIDINTLIFHEDSNRWVGVVNISPDAFAYGRKILMSTEGSSLYLHNSDSADNLYLHGSVKDWIVQGVSNKAPNVKKTFDAMAQHSSVAFDVDPIEVPSEGGNVRQMKSRLKSGKFSKREGIFYAPLLRNMLTTSGSEKQIELMKGEVMRGYCLVFTMSTNDIEDNELFKIDIYQTQSI